VVILSMHSNEAYVVEALRAGAAAYVLKESGAAELIHAVREAAAGRRYLSPCISENGLHAYVRKEGGAALDPYEALTLREKEVLHLTAEGHSGREIAQKLFISRRTVESHRASVMRKLGVHNQRELVRHALQRGLLAVEPAVPPMTDPTSEGQTAEAVKKK
jgi:DNA-binding NarL/FixJ family response regulator